MFAKLVSRVPKTGQDPTWLVLVAPGCATCQNNQINTILHRPSAGTPVRRRHVPLLLFNIDDQCILLQVEVLF